MQAGYGVGSFLIPQLLSPFLTDRPATPDAGGADVAAANASISVTTSGANANETLWTTSGREDDVATLPVGLGIVSSVTGAFAVFLLLLHFFDANHRKEQALSAASTGTEQAAASERLSNGNLEKNADVEQELGVSTLLPPDHKEKAPSFTQSKTGEAGRGSKSCRRLFEHWCGSGVPPAEVVLVMLCTCLFLVFVVAMERVFGRFLFSLARDALGWDVSIAAWLQSGFWIGFTAGRLVTLVIGNYLSIVQLLLGSSMVVGLLLLALIFLTYRSDVVVWVCVPAVGFLMGPMFPTANVWPHCFFELKGIHMMLINFSASCGGLTFIWAGGLLLERHGPFALLYLEAGLAAASLTAGLLLALVGRRVRTRKRREGSADVAGAELLRASSVNFVASNRSLAAYSASVL